MRVAVIHNLQTGGARRRLENQLGYFTGEAREICLSTARPITDDALVIPVPQCASRIPRAMRPPARYLDLGLLEAGWGLLRHAVQKLNADVMYLNPCRFLQAPNALGRRLPPAVYFCDEPRRMDAEPNARRRVNQRTATVYGPIYRRMRELDRGCVANVTSIATNSAYTASEIMRVYGRSSTVIKLGVSDDVLRSTPESQSSGFLLSVGTLIPGKGHEIVIQAAAAARHRRPVRIITPRAERSEIHRIERVAADLGVNLTIALAVSDSELSKAYASAFATLYLAEREPLGLVSLEAQAHGCPVIVSNEGGLPETILEGVSGWASPRDGIAVASFLNRLEDQTCRDAMSTSARAHAAQWSWKSSAPALDMLLEAAAATRSC